MANEYMGATMGSTQSTTPVSMVGASKVGAVDHPHRTYGEIMELLANHDMMDELVVCNKYFDYAECLDRQDKSTLAKHFVEMAHEEYEHAKIQREMLLEAGYTINEDAEAKFHETKQRFKELFRE